MTNLEKFEDEIKMMIYTGSNFAVKKVGNGEPIKCGDEPCAECKFYMCGGCRKSREDWLKEEYIEPNDNIKLPKDIKTGTPIWVKDDDVSWLIRIFCKYCDEGVECFNNGSYDSEWTNTWEYAKPFVEGVNPNED